MLENRDVSIFPTFKTSVDILPAKIFNIADGSLISVGLQSMIERFTENTPEAGARVIRAVADDLRERGMPRWVGVDLNPAALCSKSGSKIITGYINDAPVAAMIFADYDPEFWPEIPRGTSTFVHKLAVLPSYQGMGLAQEMLDYAANL